MGLSPSLTLTLIEAKRYLIHSLGCLCWMYDSGKGILGFSVGTVSLSMV